MAHQTVIRRLEVQTKDVERGVVIGSERDLTKEGRTPEYIPELALITAQPLRSNRIWDV
jgi:hypothetical protein